VLRSGRFGVEDFLLMSLSEYECESNRGCDPERERPPRAREP
jgi:hypothetical protein